MPSSKCCKCCKNPCTPSRTGVTTWFGFSIVSFIFHISITPSIVFIHVFSIFHEFKPQNNYQELGIVRNFYSNFLHISSILQFQSGLFMGLMLYIQIRYKDQPPTEEYQNAALVSVVMHVLSIVACIIAILIVDCCRLILCPFQCYCGSTIMIYVCFPLSPLFSLSKQYETGKKSIT